MDDRDKPQVFLVSWFLGGSKTLLEFKKAGHKGTKKGKANLVRLLNSVLGLPTPIGVGGSRTISHRGRDSLLTVRRNDRQGEASPRLKLPPGVHQFATTDHDNHAKIGLITRASLVGPIRRWSRPWKA